MSDPRSPARPEDVIRGALRSRPFPPETEAALAALAVLLAELREHRERWNLKEFADRRVAVLLAEREEREQALRDIAALEDEEQYADFGGASAHQAYVRVAAIARKALAGGVRSADAGSGGDA